MKVCLVSSGSSSRGGGEIYLQFLANGLVGLGCDVHVLLPEQDRMNELADHLSGCATIHRLEMTNTYDRKFRNFGAAADRQQIAKVARTLSDIDPELVHVNQQVSEDGLDLLFAAEKSKRPWISTIHVARSASSLGARFGRARDALSCHVLRKLHPPIIVVSEAGKKQLVSRLGPTGPNQNVNVVHNGVKIFSADQIAQARAEARKSWGAEDDDLVIGTVGRIEDQKNPISFIDHARPFLDRKPQLKLVWIGDGTMRSQIESHAVSSSSNLLVDGWRQDAALRIAGFDIFMLPSRYEGLPLALLEAMAAGIAIVASRTDGIPEAISNAENGLLCSTPEEWHTALDQMISSPRFRSELGSMAHKDAVDGFSLHAMAKSTMDVYLAALDAPGYNQLAS